MLDTINGLPVHPLIVHAVVVLLPLAALGVIAIAVYAPWRARFGALVVGVAAVATLAIPVTTESGESLERRVGEPGEHAELGETLIFFALPLLAVAIVLYWMGRRMTSAGPGRPARPAGRGRAVLTATLALVIALANLVQVYRVGDSGAKAVWSNAGTSTVADR